MKVNTIVLALSAVFVSTSALPTEAGDELVARAGVVGNFPSKSCKCGGNDPRASTYTVSTIKTAAQACVDHVIDNTRVGDNAYPHSYGYRDVNVNFPSSLCPKGSSDLYEFPITRGLFTGGSVTNIPDRVVIRMTSKTKATYCGLMTHIGQPGNDFASCSC